MCFFLTPSSKHWPSSHEYIRLCGGKLVMNFYFPYIKNEEVLRYHVLVFFHSITSESIDGFTASIPVNVSLDDRRGTHKSIKTSNHGTCFRDITVVT